MAGKTRDEAATNFVEFLKETLSCVCSAYLYAYTESSEVYKTFYNKNPKLLTRYNQPYLLSVMQTFEIVSCPDDPKGPYKAKTREYSYRLLEPSRDAEREVLAYHWHPHEPSVKFPHLHVQTSPEIHFPTSRVCLEDFVYMLIRDFKIKPKMKDDEWKKILNKNAQAFEEMATWKIRPQ